MTIFTTAIPRIGMGCWAIGGPFWLGGKPLGYSGSDDATSTRTIHAALDAGIRLFDTANVYGAGHSERLLGEALKSRPYALISSKLGMGFDEGTKQVLPDDTDPAGIEAQIDASLRRLQRDHIDVMFLHLNALPIEAAEPIFEALGRARAKGKIGEFGWSTDFPDNANAMAGMDGFTCLQSAMDVVTDAPGLRKTAAAHGLTTLIRSPLAMGVLTGKFGPDSRLPDTDIRSGNDDWKGYFKDGKVTAEYQTKIDALRDLLQTDGRSLAQGALCWLLAKSELNIPIPGAKTPAQIRENAGAMGHGPLPAAVMAEIEAVIPRKPEGPPRKR